MENIIQIHEGSRVRAKGQDKEGEVFLVNDDGTVFVDWDDGSCEDITLDKLEHNKV